MQAEFSVHLGGGLYMNSRGDLSRGPEPGKPVYGVPGGGLPVNFDAFAKAFQGVAKALPNKDDPKSREKFDKIFDGIGMLAENKENLIGVLQGIAGAAAVVGSVVPIVGAAFAVLALLLEIFKQGPSALELLINQRFEELNRTIKALEVQINQHDLRNQRSVIATALAAVSNYVTELKNSPPDEATLALRRQDVRNQVTLASTAVRNLVDTSTWLSTFNPNDHKWVWPWMAYRLWTFPSSGGPQRATFLAQGANCFDHRLMVPMASYGLTSFLTLLRATAPEFRSTRDHREDLWDYATALDVLITNMRKEGLARTVYTAADFQGGAAGGIPWGLGPEEVIDLSVLGIPPRLKEGNTRFVVGALDLRQHDDAYFTPGFTASRIQHTGPQYAKQGLLNVRWMPPATLEHYDEPVPTLGWEPANQSPPTQRRYRITNPEECAKAANAQAEQDFSNLLFGSGYMNLLHLLATVRHEATDPDRSQTVRSEVWRQRKPGATTAVVVESAPILQQGVITANADRQEQEYKASIWFTTQPLGRERKLNYRIWLRTLPASVPLRGDSWIADAYGNYHQVGYENDSAHPGCKQLFTSTGQALDGVKIAEGTTSAQPREQQGTAVLTANTFDYWIPVKPLRPPLTTAQMVAAGASLRASGWESAAASSPPAAAAPPALPVLGGTGLALTHESMLVDAIDAVSYADLIGSVDGREVAKAQRRHSKHSEIQVDYTLLWQADRLTVSLKNNRPSDRNYVIYVVVEETLGSGRILHTFEGIPITGQLTYVPQSFFDEEFEALAKTAKLLRDFAERYAKSLGPIPRPTGPGDPDPGWLLGVDRHVLAADPVMQAFEFAGASNPHDATKLLNIALRHPPAAAVLTRLLREE